MSIDMTSSLPMGTQLRLFGVVLAVVVFFVWLVFVPKGGDHE
jgi:hypothetical protein